MLLLGRELLERVFLSLDSRLLLCCRAACASWQHQIVGLDRWRPACLPPGTRAVSPGLAIRLYCRWRQWCTRYERLVEAIDADCSGAAAALGKLSTAWDGWCALAPYLEPRAPWLHRLLGPPAPVEPKRRLGRGKRMRSGKLAKAPTPESELSVYFQRRRRSSEEAFRLWFSEPVHAHVASVEEQRIYAAGALQLEVVHLTGDDRLAVHEGAVLARWLAVAEQALACFLPARGSFALEQRRDRSMPLDTWLVPPGFKVRRCEATGAWQLNSGVLADAGLGASRATGREYVATVHIVAAHLGSWDQDGDSGLAWCFSDLYSNREDQNLDHFVLSTYMLTHEPAFESDDERLRCFIKLLLGGCFAVACGLASCENEPCLMNNVDGIDECRAVPLLLCPACLRKLEVMGVLPDVMAALEQLQSVYRSQPRGATCFANELAILHKWLR